MKKIFIKILPLILIFIFTFSISINAESSSDWPIVADSSKYPISDDILADAEMYLNQCKDSCGWSFDFDDAYFFAYQGDSENYVTFVFYRKEHDVYVAESIPGALSHPETFANVVGNFPSGYGFAVIEVYINGDVRKAYSYGGGYRFKSGYWNILYTSVDIYGGANYNPSFLYFKSEDLNESDNTNNDFMFVAFEDFADFGEQSLEHYNNAMNQTVTENSNSPNDSVFMNILQAMTGSLTTNNSISQQISNQLQHFTEQFFNNFAQYSLGLMTDILNTLNDFTGKFDGLLDIVNQLYSSGLDSNGEFGLDNMFSYWLVPSDEFIDSQYDKLVGALPFIDEIQGISDTLLNLFQTVEPKSPTITIHAGTYGFIVLTDDCVIDFDWFLDWKPYTDIFIAVFVYAGLALHLVRQLPGILGGTSSVVNSASGLDKPVKVKTNSRKGGKGS